MTELQKLDAGLPFNVNDTEVDARKIHAVKCCVALEKIDASDRKAKKIRNLENDVDE